MTFQRITKQNGIIGEMVKLWIGEKKCNPLAYWPGIYYNNGWET